MISYLENVTDKKHFIVLHGLTGVGKTEILKNFDKSKIDNIDLENIAKNSGSTFGFIGFDEKPPSQKKFESEIFKKFFYSKTDYLFIESESKRVGHVLIPNNLYEHLVNSKYHILINDSLENRVNRLYNDYIKDKNNNIELKECIEKFRKRLGNKKVDEYIMLLNENNHKDLVKKYLLEYYDILYMHSVNKYTYNDVINYENKDEAFNKLVKFHKDLTTN